jgi:BioD-like phosphotransacetylase family protein
MIRFLPGSFGPEVRLKTSLAIEVSKRMEVKSKNIGYLRPVTTKITSKTASWLSHQVTVNLEVPFPRCQAREASM